MTTMVEKQQRRAGDGVGVMKKKIRIRDEAVVDLVISRAIRAAKKVGDSNSESPFVWRKKLERELADGVFSLEDLRMLSSAKAQKRRHKHRLVEVEQLKKKRDESLAKRVQRQEVAEWCNNNNKNNNLQDEEEDAECSSSSTLTTNSRSDTLRRVKRLL